LAELWTFCESPSERSHESVVALAGLGACGRLRGLGRRRVSAVSAENSVGIFAIFRASSRKLFNDITRGGILVQDCCARLFLK
jgi:hypothetical protein